MPLKDNLTKTPVRECSTDFQQWLWWAHRHDQVARWVCEFDIPTNDRLDMANWFIDKYLPPGFRRQLDKDGDELFPQDDSARFDFWYRNYYNALDLTEIVIEEDAYIDSPRRITLTWLENYIHECHFTYYRGCSDGWDSMRDLKPSKHWAGEKTSKRLRFEILKRDGYRCQLCGTTAQDGVKLQVDHIRPKAKGGSSFVWNLWTLCEPCNNGKRDLFL